MKAIILAAGEGSRLSPLTNTTPKPLIKIFGKSILEHNLENIYKHVSEIIIIVKYMSEEIQKHIGNEYNGTTVTYVTQGEEKGTGAALKGLNLDKDVIVINGDSIFDKQDLEKVINFNGYGVLVKAVKNPQKYGIFKIDSDGNIGEVIEKSNEYVGNLANLGVYKFNHKIFECIEQIELSARGEYELTDALNLYVKKYPLKAFEITGEFIDISYAWDILSANSYFLNNISKSNIKGEVEKGVTVKGNIVVGEGTIIKSGTYIEGNAYFGKNCIIGPNAYIRNGVVVGNNCKIGNAVEIKESSIGYNTNIAHLSYVGNSIIGNNINLGGGFMTANLRHDEENIKVMVKGILMNTGMNKFGCIIGDNSKTGMNTSVYPGRIIGNGCYTIPGEIVK